VRTIFPSGMRIGVDMLTSPGLTFLSLRDFDFNESKIEAIPYPL
jgi:hypothetical protein